MTFFAATGSATPICRNHRSSAIGFPQRHYQLNPALEAPNGKIGYHDVVVIAGARGTYVYPATDTAEISDFTALSIVPPGTDDEAVLAQLGYRIVAADVRRVTARGPAA